MSSYNGAKTAETQNDLRRAMKKSQKRGHGRVAQATPIHHKTAAIPDPEIKAAFTDETMAEFTKIHKFVTGGNVFRTFQNQGVKIVTKDDLPGLPAGTVLWITPSGVRTVHAGKVVEGEETPPAPTFSDTTLPRRLMIKIHHNNTFGVLVKVVEKFSR
jgi:hypothetical protein